MAFFHKLANRFRADGHNTQRTSRDHHEDISITVASDLHLETPASRPTYSDFSLAVDAQPRFLALLGDIGLAEHADLFAFIERQLQKFEQIFYVLGNHEPYDSDYGTARQRFRRFQDKHRGRFVLLDQSRHDLTPTTTILGCTLFSTIESAQSAAVAMFVSDFERISDWTVAQHNAAHEADLVWLNESVSRIMLEEPHRSILIFTHYAPTVQPEVHDPRHLEDDAGIRSAFMTDLSHEPCWTSPNVRAWAFGHTHHNCDFVDRATGKRVLTNQKGYRRSEALDFDPAKAITCK